MAKGEGSVKLHMDSVESFSIKFGFVATIFLLSLLIAYMAQ
jgi:hypothetical protein